KTTILVKGYYIAGIMGLEPRKYGAKHIYFNQYDFLSLPGVSQAGRKGMCWAICMRWLKSAHKHGFISNVYANSDGKRLGQVVKRGGDAGGSGDTQGTKGSMMGIKSMRRQMDGLQAAYTKTLDMDGMTSAHQDRLVEYNRLNKDKGGFGSLNASSTPYISPLERAAWPKKKNDMSDRQAFLKAAADHMLGITVGPDVRVR